jgi:ABC-2 type transport system permease protein
VVGAAEGKPEDQLRESVGRREIDGLLILRDSDSAELVVFTNPLWLGDLQQILNGERRRLKLEAMKLTSNQLADAIAPIQVSISYRKLGRGPLSMAEKIAAIFLVSITGEKQLRLTEQIISAVTPQQWIDGKILGVSAYAAISTAVIVLSALPFIIVMQVAGKGIPISVELSNPLNIIILVTITLGGFLFWNTFLAAFAATINDPNVSSRTTVLFLPLVPLIAGAIVTFKAPDSMLTRVLGLIPLTSPSALPVRIILTDVSIWEIALSLVVLFIATWSMRIVAGRIFRVGMLMYGKEPTLRELLRWMKEA